MHDFDPSTRRRFLGLAGGAALCGTIPIVTVRPAEATPAMLASAIRNLVGEAPVRTGKVKLDVPPLVENGNTVPLSIMIDNPMRPDNYVSDILVVADGNPRPGVATFHLTPLSGRAAAAARIRLAATQNIIVVVKTSDGKFVTDQRLVKVTIGGCGG